MDRKGKYWTTRGDNGKRREIMERDGKYRKVMRIIVQRGKIFDKEGKYGTEWGISDSEEKHWTETENIGRREKIINKNGIY